MKIARVGAKDMDRRQRRIERLDHASLPGCEINRVVNVTAPAPARPQGRKLLLARRPAAGARGLDARRPSFSQAAMKAFGFASSSLRRMISGV
jgi:hypothetical protein